MSERLGEHYNRYSKQEYTNANESAYSGNNYNQVYKEQNNTKLSIQQEPNIEYEENVIHICISSRDRNRSIYPNANSYMIDLPSEIKNIYSIELTQAIFPESINFSNQPYLLLKIQELEDVMMSNDRNISDAFAILQLDTANYGFVKMDKRIHENTAKIFKTPKAVLSRMTLSITDYAGVPFAFDVADTNALQNTFVFKIVTLERKRGILNHRNVF